MPRAAVATSCAGSRARAAEAQVGAHRQPGHGPHNLEYTQFVGHQSVVTSRWYQGGCTRNESPSPGGPLLTQHLNTCSHTIRRWLRYHVACLSAPGTRARKLPELFICIHEHDNINKCAPLAVISVVPRVRRALTRARREGSIPRPGGAARERGDLPRKRAARRETAPAQVPR